MHCARGKHAGLTRKNWNFLRLTNFLEPANEEIWWLCDLWISSGQRQLYIDLYLLTSAPTFAVC